MLPSFCELFLTCNSFGLNHSSHFTYFAHMAWGGAMRYCCTGQDMAKFLT